MLRFKNLSSGSSGNATLLHGRDGRCNSYLLVDCGLSLRELNKRLQAAGLADASALTAIFLTHEHSDHAAHALALCLRYRLPLYLSHGTWSALKEGYCNDPNGNAATLAAEQGQLIRLCRDRDRLSIGALHLQPCTVPHDAREPLQLRIDDGQRHFGLLTDLGHAPAHVLEHLRGCHSLLLESNHDPAMLAQSSYPPFLRARIGGDWGHLSNQQAASVLTDLAHNGLRHVVAAHLSAQNNTPTLVQNALAHALRCQAQDILVADASAGSDWLDC